MQLTYAVYGPYAENNVKAAKALIDFFQSDCKHKNFPVLEDSEAEIHPCLVYIMRWINYVNPAWLKDSSTMEKAIDMLHHLPQKMGETDNILEDLYANESESIIREINSYIGYQMIQYILNHKKDFEDLMDGFSGPVIIWQTPSPYKKSRELFSRPIDLGEISDITKGQEYHIYSDEALVKAQHNSEYIKLPKNLSYEKDLKRVKSNQDYKGDQIRSIMYQDEEGLKDLLQKEPIVFKEQAEINFFSMVNPNHIRYHQNRFQPSQQFVTVIKNLCNGLQKCNTPEDVKNFLNDKNNHINPDDYTSMVLPSILAKVFADEKQFQNRLFNEKNLKKYTDSYASIMKQNSGAKNFQPYNLFTFFKEDKDATIKFLEDFLSMRLVSDPNAYIHNHGLLVMFNIFDSRIYLDILYNVLPQSEKKGEYETEDGFVKAVRKRINDNSNKSNPYTKPDKQQKIANEIMTSQEVSEYASVMMKRLGNYTEADYPYIGDILDRICYLEASTLPDKAFSMGIDSHELEQQIFNEGKYANLASVYGISGKLPSYMSDRIKQTDQQGAPDTSIEDTELPDDVPQNDLDTLLDSIDDRVDEVDESPKNDMEDGFGKDATVTPKSKDKESNIVYNITYNYHNSNNTTNTTDSHNTTIDRSVNKTTGGTSKSVYNPKKKAVKPQKPLQSQGSNNYNNDTSSSDTNDSTSKTPSEKVDTFSTGKTTQEVFAMLQSAEPLLVGEGAQLGAQQVSNELDVPLPGWMTGQNEKPKQSLNTRLQDLDREMLPYTEKVKKAGSEVVQTGKMIKRPFDRIRDWLYQTAKDASLKDEETQKRRILEDKNYRTTAKKAFHIACDLKLYQIAFMLAPSLGFLALGVGAAKGADKSRLKKEVQKDFVTEIEIIDDKIKTADYNGDKEAKWELMRIRRRMVEKASHITKTPIEKLMPIKKREYDYW